MTRLAVTYKTKVHKINVRVERAVKPLWLQYIAY